MVDDNDELRELLVECLIDEGHQAHGVPSGFDAVRICSQFPVDLLVTDVRMADMDGLETIAAVRQHRPHLPAIIMTGYASDEAPMKALELGALDYLYKPFNLTDIIKTVDRVLNPVREREKHGLLESLARGYRKIVETVQLSSLEKDREKALQSYYLAIRSRKLGEEGAMVAWDSLEQLECQRYTLQADGELVKERRALQEGYQALTSMVTDLSRHPPQQPPPRAPGQVSRVMFLELYQRVQKGVIDERQTAFASVLRTIDPEQLQRSQELQALHAQVWGSGPA